MDTYKIIWNSKEVGVLLNAKPDMWYLEGRWEPNNTGDCEHFERLMKLLDTKEVFSDLTKGVKIYLRNIETRSEVPAIVISLLENTTLFVRVVSAI